MRKDKRRLYIEVAHGAATVRLYGERKVLESQAKKHSAAGWSVSEIRKEGDDAVER